MVKRCVIQGFCPWWTLETHDERHHGNCGERRFGTQASPAEAAQDPADEAGAAGFDDAAYVHETDRHFHQSGHLRFNHSRHFARATAGPTPRGGDRNWRPT